MWTQIVGKTRLALAPMVNHWWQVPLYVSRARARRRRAMPYGTADIRGRVRFRRSRARAPARATAHAARWRSRPRSVADFYAEYMAGLRSLGIDVRIWPVPVEIADADPVRRGRRRTRRTTPTRRTTSGARSRRPIARAADLPRRASSARRAPCISSGGASTSRARASRRARAAASGRRARTPGLGDARGVLARVHQRGLVARRVRQPDRPNPVFYAYAYPEPVGCPTATIRPAAGDYHMVMHEWILPYDAVRTGRGSRRRRARLLPEHLRGRRDSREWDRAALERAK